ncbi:integrating conjugative element protein [Salmonella enterica]|nr:integrating conjugative element protein [Salmonella enterica]
MKSRIQTNHKEGLHEMLKIMFICTTFLFTSYAGAALTVITDLGGESTHTLFEAVIPESEKLRETPLAIPLETALFPVISPNLHPGKTAPRLLSLPGISPLFILGDDPLSLRWLADKKKRLLSLNATGLAVNVASETRLDVLRQQADGLKLLPVSGDDLAQRLQLETYPVLITESGLSQ